ncbi:MAG: hypothetical protein A4E35_02408 [Methanoregula sp. PtaU1.Bin051]|nr:MAG: hypothetical protein A4E35_02408 [Methanoregula sp. PtaU1.Bin051]
MLKPCILGLILLVIVVSFTAGCTSSTLSNNQITTTQSQPTTATTTITTPDSQVTVSGQTSPSNTSVTITTQIPTATQQVFTEGYVTSASDPLVRSFSWRATYLNIKDCVMRRAFPEIANDPGYGTRADPPKVTGISGFELDKFVREYYEGKGQTSTSIGFSCEDTPGTDKWDFLAVGGVLVPRNIRPSVYDVIIVVRKNGKIIAELRSNETFTMDTQVNFYTYIPLKQKEMPDISGCEIHFTRLTNI